MFDFFGTGGQLMQYSLPGTGRGSTPQTPFYPPSRAPLGSQRMAHARPSVVMSNSAQSFMSQPVYIIFTISLLNVFSFVHD